VALQVHLHSRAANPSGAVMSGYSAGVGNAAGIAASDLQA
jgi:hypothetical protein